jgi:glycosyltransferase involved in cell wall biosynthesis
MLVATVKGKRLVARYGGSWRTNRESTFATRATRALMRRLARGPSVMLATGDADAISEPGVAAIFSTALSSRELASASPALARNLAAPPHLVYVGRLSKEKGVDVLLRAFAQVPGPVLTLAGDGPERGALGALANELGISGRVSFLGQRDRAELSGDLDEADVCVQASRTEGFSKAWLDAMAHGLPVVSSDVGAARAVIGADGERGWLVPPGDPAALARKLRRVLHEPRDWPALRRRCRAFAEGKTLEAWARRIGEICAAKWGLSLVEGKLR